MPENIASDSALRRSGRLSVMVAIEPPTSARMSSLPVSIVRSTLRVDAVALLLGMDSSE